MADKLNKPRVVKAVTKRNLIPREELGGANSSFPGDNHPRYGKLNPMPRNTNGQLFYEYREGYRHAFLAVGNGRGGIEPASRFEFWVTSVDMGFGSAGSTEQSKFYATYYSRSFNRTPLRITGRVPNEAYREDMQLWIREAQITMAAGRPRMMLGIPSAHIEVWGYIPSFQGGAEQGFEPAPEIQFEFTVTRDVRTDKAGNLSQQIIAYFLDPKDNFWRKESQAFVGATYDANQAEIDADREMAKRKIANKKKNENLVNTVVDFFNKGF